MKCDACGQENRHGRKFCGECGAALIVACPACAAGNQPGERFCGECGTALGESPNTPPKTVAVQPTPRPAARGGEGERKQITVLFADVQGSMDLQEDLDPEIWAGIMGRFVEILAGGVERFGGTVDKFTGDGIMALFGAPMAQEDHARRACHAAWHLTTALGVYADELRRVRGVDLHVRLGLNSGEVVVGRVGEEVQLDSTALGHTVGLAQRMEALAEPGRVYLTGHTARLVDGWFDLVDLGPVAVKGSRHPLPVFALGGPAAAVACGGRALGATPLIGRERELAVLDDALAAAAEGRAQIVGVVGEAGVGKSRLCEDFARAAVARGFTVRRTAGVSHGREMPLLPVLALLRQYFGINEADSPQQARERVADRLLAHGSLDDDLPALLDFLEIPDPSQPVLKLAPEVRTRRIFETLRRLTARRSEQETLVLVFEDLHWFDPQSEAFLERLVESYSGSRTLVVTNFRPEFSAEWMRHSYYRQLPLDPLQEDAVGQLLGGLLGMDFSLAPLLGFIVDRTGGNPFFVEEVVRALVEDGTLVGDPGKYRLTRPLQEVKVPPSVQAVLASRIDRLPEQRKSLLQTAAVIGRTFSLPVLAGVTGSTAEALEDELRALCRTELVQEVGHDPVSEYRFWHPLTQEVAYGSLLSGRRADLHAAVAASLIDHDPNRLDQLAAMVGWHWECAGRPLEAARWNVRAGSFALRSDLHEARRRWQVAVDLLAGVEETPDSLELGVRARMRLLQFGARTGIDAVEAERLYIEGRALAERLDDIALLAMITLASGTFAAMRGDLRNGYIRYLEAAHLGERLGDDDAKSGVQLGGIFAHAWAGPLSASVDWAERVLRACAEDPDRGVAVMGYSALAMALQMRSRAFLRMGRLSEATADIERAVQIARPRGNHEIVSWALSLLPELKWLEGEPNGDRTTILEAVQLAEETGNWAGVVLALEGLTFAQLSDGEAVEAVTSCERALAEGRTHQAGLFVEAEVLSLLGRSRLAAGDSAGALLAAEEGVAVAARQGARVSEGIARLARAHVRAAAGGSAEAVLADLDAALALVRDTGAIAYEPFIREELGRLRNEDAELREARRLFAAMGAPGHVRRLDAELGARL